MALSIPARDVAYGDRETLLYALAVGFGIRGATEELPFVYERELRVVPSMATMLAFDDTWLGAGGIDLQHVVHGALDITFHRPLASAGAGRITARISGVSDKGTGRGGLVFQESVVAQGRTPACTVRSTMFVRGAGGFGGSVGEFVEVAAMPNSAHHESTEVVIAQNQALLFRLLGDRNPLHVDPSVAQLAGFPRPILHGACTFGIACAETLRRFCDHDPARLVRFAARFAGPLHPGETLRFDFWHTPSGIAFRASAAQRQAIVLDNGLAVLTS